MSPNFVQEVRRSELTMIFKYELCWTWTTGTACYCDLETLEVIRMKMDKFTENG